MAATRSGFITNTTGTFESADWARLTDAMFRDSLTQALTQSELFRSVNGEGNPDCQIEGRLYTQQLYISGIELTATIGVRYKLVALPSNKRVWSDNLVSQGITGKRESDVNEIARTSGVSDFYPGRCVIAGLFPSADYTINPRTHEAFGHRRTE
jgi:hypothetical protein